MQREGGRHHILRKCRAPEERKIGSASNVNGEKQTKGMHDIQSTDRQIDRQIERERQRETDRQIDRERERDRERQIDRQIEREIDGRQSLDR